MFRMVMLFLLASAVFSTNVLGQDDLSPLIPVQVLKSAGLKPLWQNPLSVRASEYVKSMEVLGNNLYVLTSSNYLYGINTANGKLAFGVQLSPPGYPVLEPVVYDNNELLVVSASKLLFIGAEFGSVTSWTLPNRAAAPAARNKRFLYVPGTDNVIHVFDINDKTHSFDVAADDDTLITSVIAQDERVLFASKGGQIVSMHIDSPTKWWTYNIKESVTAPIAADGNSVYAASWDTNLYRLKLTDGKLLWKCQLAGILKHEPIVTETIVYQYVQDRGISAIDVESGKELWAIPDAIAFLSQADGKTYLLTSGRTAVTVDNVSGKVLQRINFSGAAVSAPNARDARIFISSKSGKVQCIAPEE